MSNFYDQLCQSFIRPSRQIYSICDLGPPLNKQYKRSEFEVLNPRGHKIIGSFYQNINTQTDSLIIYLHGLNGSRLQSLGHVSPVILKGFNFCSFDFCGSGISDGDFVSLGHHQSQDIEVVLNYLSENKKIKSVFLWGRSMGASSALRFMETYNNEKESADNNLKYSISGLILDSPFQSLPQLIIQIVKERILLPELLIKAALIIVESTIKQKAGFKITDMQLLPKVKFMKCPILLLASKEDKLVPSIHSQKIYQMISHKDKEIFFIKEQHNSPREESVIEYALSFLLKFIQRNKMKRKGMNLLTKSEKQISYKGHSITNISSLTANTNLKQDFPKQQLKGTLSFDKTYSNITTENPENPNKKQVTCKLKLAHKLPKKPLQIHSQTYYQLLQTKGGHKKTKSCFDGKNEVFVSDRKKSMISDSHIDNPELKTKLFSQGKYQLIKAHKKSSKCTSQTQGLQKAASFAYSGAQTCRGQNTLLQQKSINEVFDMKANNQKLRKNSEIQTESSESNFETYDNLKISKTFNLKIKKVRTFIESQTQSYPFERNNGKEKDSFASAFSYPSN